MPTVLPHATLALHPPAATAFDVYAALGDLGLQGGPIRAVQQQKETVLAFTGFARLRGTPEERIELRLLAMPPRVWAVFARAVAGNAASAQPKSWGIASPARLAAGLAPPARSHLREDPAPVRMIDVLLARRCVGTSIRFCPGRHVPCLHPKWDRDLRKSRGCGHPGHRACHRQEPVSRFGGPARPELPATSSQSPRSLVEYWSQDPSIVTLLGDSEGVRRPF